MVLRRFRRKRDAEARRYAYSRWDGSQAGFDLNAFDLFAELSDELIHHGDPNSALRNLLQQGFDVTATTFRACANCSNNWLKNVANGSKTTTWAVSTTKSLKNCANWSARNVLHSRPWPTRPVTRAMIVVTT